MPSAKWKLTTRALLVVHVEWIGDEGVIAIDAER